jgi:hypothetical protein
MYAQFLKVKTVSTVQQSRSHQNDIVLLRTKLAISL